MEDNKRNSTSQNISKFATTRTRYAVAAAAVTLASHAGAFTWNQDGGPFEWKDAANWLPSTGFPDAIDEVADFDATDALQDNVIYLGADESPNVTIGSMTVGDTAASGDPATLAKFTFNPVLNSSSDVENPDPDPIAGPQITFDVTDGSASLVSNGGELDVRTGLVLNDDLVITNTGGDLSLDRFGSNEAISGTGGIVYNGSGASGSLIMKG